MNEKKRKNEKLLTAIKKHYTSQTAFAEKLGIDIRRVNKVVFYRPIRWKKGEKEKWTKLLDLPLDFFDSPPIEVKKCDCGNPVGENCHRFCEECLARNIKKSQGMVAVESFVEDNSGHGSDYNDDRYDYNKQNDYNETFFESNLDLMDIFNDD